MEFTEERLTTEVLVLGSGAAASMAALRAEEEGAKVLIVTKGAFGAGNTPLAPGGFEAAIGHADSRDNPQTHFEDTVKGGLGLSNEKVAWAIAHEMTRIPFDLEEWGCPLPKDGEKFLQRPTSLLTYPRIMDIGDETGKFLTSTFKNEIRKRGIQCLTNVMVTNFLTKNSRIIGAFGVDLKNFKFLVIVSKVTVLACGGMGQLYRVTDNSLQMTGDGYAMAYRAGAEIRDMEMVEFQLTRYLEGLKSGPTKASVLLFAGGRLYNAKGERFMKKYAPQTLEKSSRAQINKCVAVEIREGRGTSNGCVYLDLSDVSGEYLKEKIPYNLKTFLSRGIDLTYQPMELCPVVHTFLGGVEIDEFGRTRLNSLYSAGEVTGGLHGANRLGGNALSDALGMGSIAGRQAALQSKSSEFRSAEEAQVHEEKARIKKLLERNFGVDPTKVRDELQTLMWKNVGIVRDGHELSSNLEALERLKEELLPKLYVSGKDLPQELRRALELENMVLVAEIITRAALMRKESRGVHTRLDYPETDPEWLKNIIICRENDEMRILTRPVVELPKQ